MPFLRNDYRNYPQFGLVGAIADSTPHQIWTYSNASGTVAQATTINAGTPAASTTYSVTVRNERQNIERVVSLTTGATAPSAAAFSTQLAAALSADPVLGSNFSFTALATGVTVTSLIGGVAGSFQVISNLTQTAVTTASDPATLAFGRLVVMAATSALTYTQACKLPSSSAELNNFLAGFVARTDAYQRNIEQGYYGIEGANANAPVNVMSQGAIYVQPVTDLQWDSPIHVYISGSNQGRISNVADGANTAQYTGGRLQVLGRIRAGETGIVVIK